MKTKIFFLSIILLLVPANVFAQSRDASAAVKEFYGFHLKNQDVLNAPEISRRRRFFTPRLGRLFDAELKRQTAYSKKYPDEKPYFEGLSFTPIELCAKDYSVEKAETSGQKATVKVNFVYSKSSCDANDGTKIFYTISLQKIGGKWLIDDVTYDNGETLSQAFEKAKQQK